MPSYGEKLKDPRWQRKRLEILQRSDFSCEQCGTQEKTLHVHHKVYRKGAAPWEYADEELEALCEDCHGTWHEIRERIDHGLQALPISYRMTVLGFVESMVDDARLSRDHLTGGIAAGRGDYLTGYAAALLQQFGWVERAGALLPELIDKHGQCSDCLWAFAITLGHIPEHTKTDDFDSVFWEKFESVAQKLRGN